MNAAWTTLPVTSMTLASAGIAVVPAGPDRLDDAAAHDDDARLEDAARRGDDAGARQGVRQCGRASRRARRPTRAERAGRGASAARSRRRRKFSMRRRDSICFAVAGAARTCGPPLATSGTGGHDDVARHRFSEFRWCSAGAGLATAQDRTPLSPPGTRDGDGRRQRGARRTRTASARTPGGKWIEVTYSRPDPARPHEHLRHGRRLRQDRQRRRAGLAGRRQRDDELKTEVPLMIGGKRIEPGSYDVLRRAEGSRPGRSSSRRSRAQEKYDDRPTRRRSGASYNYDPKFDVVRVPMTMLTPKASIDQFTIGFVRHDGRPAASSRWSGRRRRRWFRSRSRK